MCIIYKHKRRLANYLDLKAYKTNREKGQLIHHMGI